MRASSVVGFITIVISMMFQVGFAIPVDDVTCNEGCQITSEDAYGSVWEPQLYNYTVDIVTVMIDTANGAEVTAIGARFINPLFAFESASVSIQSLHKFHHGVFVVDGTKTEMLGTTLTWPSSDLRLAKYTATATIKARLEAGRDVCKTTTSIYTRSTDKFWEPMGTADGSWLSETLGLCNPCSSGSVSEIGTRLGDIPKRLYTTNSELAKCTKATMDDEPMTKVALVAVTSTRTVFIGGDGS